MTLFEYDAELGIPGFCGVDEAGRGPLAGDVYAAAVILSPDRPIPGINDSKKLSEKKREALFDEICEKAVSYSIATASIAEIDSVNILQATFLAMRRAVEGLSVKPSFALIDGDKNPNVSVPSRFLVGGDAKSASIAAASILAKVARDRYMKTLDQQYPDYQFAKHKGYGTKLHYEKLDELGISPVHRKSFLKKYLAQKEASMFSTDGQLGENIAAAHLEAAGCQILIRNYHSPYGEIDIIAKKDGFLLFVEVKTRSNEKFSTPREAVTSSKQQKICQTAAHFLVENHLDAQPRFDIIEVVGDPEGEVTIDWFENAFTSKEFGEIV